MGLNKVDGEELPGIGRGRVASAEKWQNTLGMIEQAAQAAADHFHKAGAPRDITLTEENFVIQEYWLVGLVVMVFWLPIKGEDFYYPYTFKLGDKVLRELAAVGKWPMSFALPMEALH